MSLPFDFDLGLNFSRSGDFSVGLSLCSSHLLGLGLASWKWTSFNKVDFTCSRVRCFPSGLMLPKVTTSVSQLSGRDPNNNNANTSSARGTSRRYALVGQPLEDINVLRHAGAILVLESHDLSEN